MIEIKIKDILDKKHMSMYALSKAIDINPNNLNKLIKNETKSIRFDTLEKIVKVLDVDFNSIFQIKRD